MTFDHDLFVIGGGSGGVRAARLAASEGGANVALAEESRMGGTCVIRGCVPKKLMVFASEFPAAFEEARAYGWDVTAGGFDWPAFRRKLHGELDRLEGVYRGNLTRAGVEILDTRATLADAHTVRLADGSTRTARHILIATGGHPWLPDTVAAAGALTSNDMFHLDTLPGSIAIVGGGYIASEFACILNGMGVSVTQFYRGGQILRGFDDEARGHVAEAMRASGIELRVNTVITALETAGAATKVTASDGTERQFDAVLYATGRVANTAGLGLENAGVPVGRGGEVVVDAWSQTAVPSIYAIGDVTDRLALTPVAIREGAAFVETVFKANPTPPDNLTVPSAVFTQPALGTVGMGEAEAAAEGPVEIYAASFRPMRTAFAGGAGKVLMKLVVAAGSRRVVGCHIVAEEAGELIQLAAIAVKMGATKEDFDRTVAVHPTMSEEIVTLKAPVRTA